MRMSDALAEIERSAEAGPVTLETVVERVGARGHAIAILVLCVPFLQPVPMIGLSAVFGLAIATIAIAYARDRPPWLPRRIGARELPPATVRALCGRGRALFARLERVIRPRGAFFHRHASMRRLAAVVIVAAAGLLALPVPVPAANLVPTIPIVLLALGLLEEDGWLVGAGYLAFAAAVVAFAALFAVPMLGLLRLAAPP